MQWTGHFEVNVSVNVKNPLTIIAKTVAADNCSICQASVFSIQHYPFVETWNVNILGVLKMKAD